MYTLYRERYGDGYLYLAEPISEQFKEKIDEIRKEEISEGYPPSLEFITYFDIRKKDKLQLIYGHIVVLD